MKKNEKVTVMNFQRLWRAKDQEERYVLLMEMTEETLLGAINEHSELFADVLCCLQQHLSSQNVSQSAKVLQTLSGLDRLSLMLDFLTKSQQEIARSLLNNLADHRDQLKKTPFNVYIS